MIGTMTSARERIGRFDVAVAVVATLVAAGDMLASHYDDDLQTSVLAVPLFAGVTMPLLWRRAAPLAALAATNVALLVHVAAFGDDAVRCGIVIPVALVLGYSAGARLERNEALLGLALAMALNLVVCLTDAPSGAPPAAFAFLGPITAAVWGGGRLVRSRGRMVAELAARTSELRQARDERARLEVTADRARLSAELETLLHRRLGDLAQLAEGGPGNGDPARAGATLEQIERDSRETLEEMRAVVGALRSDSNGAPLTPPPTLTQLDAMVVRAKGADTRLSVEGSPRALPPGLELSAYRILEDLLDAVRDAPGVDVAVRFADDALELRVTGPARRRGDQAIARARERVRLHSGTLRASTHDGRAQAVVSLPIFAAV